MTEEGQSVFARIKSLPFVRAGVAYAATAFVIVQVVDLISESFGLTESVMRSVIWVGVAGFPIVILLSLMISSHFSTAKLLLMTLGILVVGYLGAAFYWVTYVKAPQLEAAVNKDEYAKSWIIAREMDQVLPFLPQIKEALEALGRPATIDVKQDGVDVYWQPYASEEYTWEYLGATPLDVQFLPVGPIQLRLEKEGYQTAYLSMNNPGLIFKNFPVEVALEPSKLELAKDDDVLDGMVYVPGGPFFPAISGETPKPYVLSPFYIDQYEVTNKQFKAFIKAGGYDNPRYWQEMDFIKDGESLTLDTALALMVDQTGRHAPAGWELADYPQGKGNYPVTGISWYEAQAYARYKGNILPPMFHWAKAAFPVDEVVSPLAPAMLSHSNFSGNSITPVGQFKSYGPYGTFDMAGNAREWVWNIFGGEGVTLGGAVSEPQYTGFQPSPRPRFDRSELNGFRTIRLLNPADMNPFGDPVNKPEVKPPEFYKPLDDAAFKLFSTPFSYGRRALNAKTVYIDESNEDWIKEKVSIELGYNKERMDVLIFRPKNISSNLGSVIVYPGLNYFTVPPPIDDVGPGDLGYDFVIKSGRALVWPAFDGTLNRMTDSTLATGTTEDQLRQYRDMMVRWRIDTGRVLDYLEDREDFDNNNVNYLGMSYGAIYMPIVLLYEDRFNAAVLLSGGFDPFKPPHSDGIVYEDRIKTPVLMLNGEQDYLVPVRGQEALFDVLGANENDKRHVLFKAGHWPLPRNQMVNEILNWLDKYKK
jgi:formylglycine-generating enzyme required for sulfatase activity/dienelactone hydrolase